jgi:hypothetical protein
MLFPLVRTLPRPQQSWLSPVSAEHDGHQIAKTRWTFKIKIFQKNQQKRKVAL